ncbi:MAG: hypothetical protein PHQ35_09380 [Phycisphaerae bacterium]|nr:hypothetical protein [Phycisphaerae bacterium]MDD5239928.1 hypothetical protein [Candidatus Nanoarchaeia archaeon]
MFPSKEKIEEIIMELQRIMRIQDWNIDLKILTELEMLDYDGDKKTGAVTSDYEDRNLIIIRFNKDLEQNQYDNWYNVIIHELKHVQSMKYYNRVYENMKFIKDEELRKELEKQQDIFYEALIDRQAREFEALYPVTNFIKEDENVT